MIITVTLNPAIDQTIEVDRFTEGDDNLVESIRLDIGGKGINVARVLKELGYEPLAVGFAPGDLGRMIEDQLQDMGIGTDFTFLPGETRTNITIMDRARQRHTVLRMAGPEVPQEDMQELLRRLKRRLRPDTWLVVAGSLPPPFDAELYTQIIHAAEEAGALTALDADGKVVRQILDTGGRPTLVKLNSLELSRVFGDPVGTEDEVLEAAEQIRVMGVPAVVATRSGQGAVALTPEADYRVIPPGIEVQSAVGAGDSFMAGLLLALRRGDSWPDALSLAAAAGTACCLTPGTTLCRGRDVRRLRGQVVVERVVARGEREPVT